MNKRNKSHTEGDEPGVFWPGGFCAWTKPEHQHSVLTRAIWDSTSTNVKLPQKNVQVELFFCRNVLSSHWFWVVSTSVDRLVRWLIDGLICCMIARLIVDQFVGLLADQLVDWLIVRLVDGPVSRSVSWWNTFSVGLFVGLLLDWLISWLVEKQCYRTSLLTSQWSVNGSWSYLRGWVVKVSFHAF